MVKTLVWLLLGGALGSALAGCTAQEKAQVLGEVVTYSGKIAQFCQGVLPLAQSLPVEVAAGASVVVSDVQKAVIGGCGTAEGIAAMAQSATTLPWLATARMVLSTGGAVMPPPVAPVSLTRG